MSQPGSTIDENGNVSAPQWRFGLCDVFALPTLCGNVICCPACVLAQIAGRAKEYVFVKDFNAFFKMVVGLIVTIYVCDALIIANDITLQTANESGDIPRQSTLSTYYTMDTIFRLIIGFCAFAYLIIAVLLRIRVRAQKNIQPNLIEDVICTMFCSCCVVIQTAREVGIGEECMNTTDPNNDPATMQMSRSDDGSATGFDKV